MLGVTAVVATERMLELGLRLAETARGALSRRVGQGAVLTKDLVKWDWPGHSTRVVTLITVEEAEEVEVTMVVAEVVAGLEGADPATPQGLYYPALQVIKTAMGWWC